TPVAVPRRAYRRHVQGLLGLDAGLDRDQGLTVRRVAAWLHTHARVRLAALLAAPLLWLVGAYLGALAVLLVSAFWTVNTFTGQLVEQPTLANFTALLHGEVYRTVALRTVGVAAGVT